jgi:anti-sigma B factor antagonist
MEYYNIIEFDGHTILEFLVDKLNLFETPRILTQFEEMLDASKYPHVIVDLKNVMTIDSVGIGFLIAIKNVLSKHGKSMFVVSDREVILKIFSITKMDEYFKIFRDRQSAVDAVASLE